MSDRPAAGSAIIGAGCTEIDAVTLARTGPATQHRRPSGEEDYLERSDLDGNLVVNAGDFGAILATWQQSCR